MGFFKDTFEDIARPFFKKNVSTLNKLNTAQLTARGGEAGEAKAKELGRGLITTQFDYDGGAFHTGFKGAIDKARAELAKQLKEQRKKALASLRRTGATNNTETSKQLGVQAPENLLGAKQTVLNTANGGTSLLGG